MFVAIRWDRRAVARRAYAAAYAYGALRGFGVSLFNSSFFILHSKIVNRQSDITGRLAPSPTGCLHLGNARSFLLAWLQVRALGGRIVLRIEDLDGPRAVAGADREIVRDLEWLGLDWDNELSPEYYQSNRYDLYREAIARLEEEKHLFRCYCSRRALREAMSAPHGRTGLYPGTCRDLSLAERDERAAEKDPALRLRVEPQTMVAFTDLVHGKQRVDLCEEVGDFIVARADGVPAYHLAVVLDDIAMGVTHVLRGDDLLEATPAQVRLIELFEGTIPTYAHVPIMLDEKGKRMAKRFGAKPLGAYREEGISPKEIVGRLAASIGLIKEYHPLTPQDLLPTFTLSSLNS